MLLITWWRLSYSLSADTYWAVEGGLWTMPKVLALEMATYCAGKQAHKPLIVEHYGGPMLGPMLGPDEQYGGHGGRKQWLLLGWFGNGFPAQISPTFMKPTLFFRHKWPLLFVFPSLSLCACLDQSMHCVMACTALCLWLFPAQGNSYFLYCWDFRVGSFWPLWWVFPPSWLPNVGKLLLISHPVSGETRSLGSTPSLSRYLSSESETGVRCAMYEL